MLSFLPPGHPVLQTRAEEIPPEKISSKEVQAILEEMFILAGKERSDPTKKMAIGLAATQVGILKRIILVDVEVDKDRTHFGQIKAYINPKITWKSEELEIGREACFSVDGRIAGIVYRPRTIFLEAYDAQGNFIKEKFEGFTARIFQHEIDHLDGILFPDRIGKDGILHWVLEEEFPEYRKSWQSWPNRCSWETWLHLKEGKKL